MKKNKIVQLSILFVVLLLGSLAVSALDSDFNISVKTIKNDIYEDDAALYELVIRNNADFDENFEKISTYQPDWIVYTEPGLLSVPANSEKTFTLSLDPKSNVIPAQYSVQFSLRSSITKEFVDENVILYIRPLNQAFPGYKASIALSVDIPYEINPKNEVPITIYLRNRNALNIENMTIQIVSNVINEEITFSFLPLEEKTMQLRYKLNDYQIPIEDTLTINLIIQNYTINKRSIPVKVIGYSDLKEEKIVKKSILKKVSTITLTNDGNIVNNENYLIPVTSFENLFTSTEPDSTKIVNGEIFRSVTMNLKSQESLVLEVETNYRIIVYTLLLMILIIISYYQFRSPIVLKKRIIPINEGGNEGITEFHIRILLINRTKHHVENVGIIEIVPKIMSVIKEQHIGTMEPTKVIKHDKKGTLLKWDVNYLEPFEERIITFKIMSKLGIVGSLVLPKTKAKYENNKGRQRVTYSRKEAVQM